MSSTLTRAADEETAVSYAARIAHVSKSFGRPGAQQLVLDDISIDVAPGEFVTLLGASGCGKSTLLNLVAGLDRPSAGEIDVPGGRPALMFQEHALFPWLTAGKNIELALKMRGLQSPSDGPRPNGCWSSYASRVRTASGCTSSPAACASAWPWPAPSRRPASCC